jgi:hypothetical protein
MENEVWDKLELFVGTPLVNIVIPHYVNEIQEQLTSEQLEPLGDITVLVTKILSVKSDIPARKSVENLIYLAKKGVIKKKSK